MSIPTSLISELGNIFTKIKSYQVLATTTNNIPKSVFTINVANNSNFVVEITASGKSTSGASGFYISQINRIINNANVVEIISINNYINTSIPNVEISLTKIGNIVSIKLTGANVTNIDWTLFVNVIVA